MLSVFGKHLASDPLQFGFKQNSSYSHALFTLRTVIDYYIKNGSTVNICALDISKAFDKVDHFALFNLLMDRHLPKCFIAVLIEWLSKCFACVRWNGVYSNWFLISAGVRQGGILSPTLFSIYMDPLIANLRQLGLGCQIHGCFYGCLIYADDILLVSQSVNAIRRMLAICDDFAVNFDVKFNSTKSVAMRIGKRFQTQCAPLILAGLPLKHVDTVKYLGVHLVAATKWKLSVEHLKLRFYRAFNCIYARCSATSSELITFTVQLLKSFCLPFILYASEAVSLSTNNIRSLDNCINRALYKIFGVNQDVCEQRYFIHWSE